MALTSRLKSLREIHNLTQQDLSTYLNISRQGYSHYENGNRIPDFHVLERIASLYDLTIDELLAPCNSTASDSEKVVRETPSPRAVEGLSRRNQIFLNLFSELSQEDKEDFIDLVSIKLHQHRIRKSAQKFNKE